MAHIPGQSKHAENAANRREAIVQTARRIIDEGGPNVLSAERVTREVGLSRPMLYHYFPGVSALVSAVVDIYVERFAQQLEEWEGSVTPAATADMEAWSLLVTSQARASLVDGCPLLIGAAPDELPGSWTLFLGRCAEVVADHALERRSPALEPMRRMPEPRAAIYLAVVGFAGMLYHFPEMGDEAAAAVFAGMWETDSEPAALAAEAVQIAGVASAESAKVRDAAPAD
jgi:AcrR family transcriptional regulator